MTLSVYTYISKTTCPHFTNVMYGLSPCSMTLVAPCLRRRQVPSLDESFVQGVVTYEAVNRSAYLFIAVRRRTWRGHVFPVVCRREAAWSTTVGSWSSSRRHLMTPGNTCAQQLTLTTPLSAQAISSPSPLKVRIQSKMIRHYPRFGLCIPTSLCGISVYMYLLRMADSKLFHHIQSQSHCLSRLLPPGLRPRGHSYALLIYPNNLYKRCFIPWCVFCFFCDQCLSMYCLKCAFVTSLLINRVNTWLWLHLWLLCICMMCVRPRSERNTTWAINTKVGIGVQGMAVARHAMTLRLKGQRSRSRGYACRYDCFGFLVEFYRHIRYRHRLTNWDSCPTSMSL